MEHLLSNIEVLLLSIVNEKPSYAYEIDKIIELREIKKWARIGVASIYRVLIKLEEKGLVSSVNEKEGKMPERKRYYITDLGRKALTKEVKRLLSSLEWYYLDLNLGLEACGLLSSEEVSICLNKRLAKVRSNMQAMEQIYKMAKGLPGKKRIIMRNLIYLRSAEEKILRHIIQNINDKISDTSNNSNMV